MGREPCDLVKTRKARGMWPQAQLTLETPPPTHPGAPFPSSILFWSSPCHPHLTVPITNLTQARARKGGRLMGLGGPQGAQSHRGVLLWKV